jgi:photosystem II stability/assembly factor-like uncharacterized protein
MHRTVAILLSLAAITVIRPAPAAGQQRRTRRAPPPAPLAPAPAAAAAPLDTLLLRGLRFRSIGPAVMGGRVSAFAVRENNPSAIFAATGTGGLFKTTNNGTTWTAAFEDQPVASIGSVAVSQSDSTVVWVGTGEGNGRNSSSWGNGVYRSSDDGAKWTHVGLDNTHDIPALAIDPRNNDVVWVAALGHLWGKNPERGIYKTTDGGKTWTPVLQLGDSVGAIDVVLDPGNADVAYAAMYQRLRTPWSMRSGGPVGGIYKTSDGGKTWTKLTEGLPAQTGRIGLEIYRKNPHVLYAVVESDLGGPGNIDDVRSRTGGLFRSDDGGAHWRRLSPLAPRAFYFTKVKVEPANDARVYVLGFGLHISDDSGHTFRQDGADQIHGDLHALWIDPANPRHLVLGTDGGIYFSYDRAGTWDFQNNAALGEFYEVTYDYRTPYRVCGGLQDNGSFCGPNRTRGDDGVTNGSWIRVADGDGYYVQVDSTDPDIVYAESQGGFIGRLNLRNGEQRFLQPQAKEGTPAFRFNWDTPFAISRHDPTTLYLGGNRLFKLSHRGERWEAISPDLSTMNPQTMITAGSGAETYNTIVSFAESPLKAGVLWAGTDDGNIQVSTDGGATWTNVGANIRGLPKPNLYVARIEASHFDTGTAFVAIDGHRSDVFRPLLFVTTDYGRTWSGIAGNLPATGPVKAVRQDPRNKNLLFAGTEFALYFSIDRGATWNRFRSGLPTVAYDDIQIHPRDRDLIVATHGRSFYVLDQISALQELTPAVLDSSAYLFTIRPAQLYWNQPGTAIWGNHIFQAKNPPNGAYIDYYLKSFTPGDVSITIADSAGHEVQKLTGSRDPGVNRVVWDLTPKPALQLRGQFEQPPFVAPGPYTVTLSVGERKLKTTLTVLPLP